MTRLLWRKAALLLGASLLVPACGGKSGGDDDEPATFLDEPGFRELFPGQLCALIAGCCERISAPIDDASCRAQAGQLLDEMRLDGAVYDGAAAAACLNAYSSAVARCAVPGERTLGDCDRVYDGSVPSGGACVSDRDCADGAFCTLGAAGARVCLGPSDGLPRAAQGETCSASCGFSSSEPCGAVSPTSPATNACYAADGLECHYLQLVCVPLPTAGEPCGGSYCAPGAYCDGSSGAFVCADTLPDGEPCASAEQCSSGKCNGTCGVEAPIDAATCGNF